MPIFKYGTLPSWILNPIGNIIEKINGNMEDYNSGERQSVIDRGAINRKVDSIWNDVTGQTAIDKQNEANKELAEYQTQMQEEMYNKYSSPEAMVEQYKAAGLNPNLMYSGVSSGQGNVPGYNPPHIERRLSKSEQFARGMSVLQSVFNLQSIMYQTSAQKELANQGLIKTLQMNENLRKSRRDNLLQGAITGFTGGLQYLLGRRYARHGNVTVGSDPLYEYADAARSLLFNQALDRMYNNAYKYGNYWDSVNGPSKFGVNDDFLGTAYWDWYNKKYAGYQREFNFNWDNDYKTMLKSAGVASPIIQTLLRLFGNSKF